MLVPKRSYSIYYQILPAFLLYSMSHILKNNHLSIRFCYILTTFANKVSDIKRGKGTVKNRLRFKYVN